MDNQDQQPPYIAGSALMPPKAPVDVGSIFAPNAPVDQAQLFGFLSDGAGGHVLPSGVISIVASGQAAHHAQRMVAGNPTILGCSAYPAASFHLRRATSNNSSKMGEN